MSTIEAYLINDFYVHIYLSLYLFHLFQFKTFQYSQSPFSKIILINWKWRIVWDKIAVFWLNDKQLLLLLLCIVISTYILLQIKTKIDQFSQKKNFFLIEHWWSTKIPFKTFIEIDLRHLNLFPFSTDRRKLWFCE